MGSEPLFLTGAEFRQCIQLRGDLLPSKVRLARILSGNIECEVRRVPHTLGRVLQTCSRTHGVRIYRHNRVCGYLASTCERLGYKGLREPMIKLQGQDTFLKPDLVVVKGEDAHVVDVAICGDNVDQNSPHMEKVKYDSRAIKDSAEKHFPGTVEDCKACVINWHGGYSRLSTKDLQDPVLSWGQLSAM